ncbi:MAG: phenylalanine--tRNA ligase subunit beta [Patescibacteria group bacterium]|nr:phenylalanine--tRNA ligase subunit beta [Patescibacteria group bacterium]
MNILIPHKWLLDHLETDATPEQIQKYLSLSGPSVERIYDREGDRVYDIEVTTNRVDSMSVRGIAREAAVILKRAGIKAALKPAKLPSIKPTTKTFKPTAETIKPTAKNLPLPKIVNSPDLCNRILAVVLHGVEASPTPDWMTTRLKQVEQNIHNSMVDITNYITHDLGHPCHAFDYDKIMAKGGKIIVKEAKAGKKFVTLDEEKYQTLGGEIVFENQAGEIIDLPAVKGTKNTSVSNSTKNILLWIENLDAKKVRFASMSHAIRTVAAQLNEKNVDPHLGKSAMLKGIELYQQLTGAKMASELYDEFPHKVKLEPVTITHNKIYNYLGVELKAEEIKTILTDLGCKVEVKEGDGTKYDGTQYVVQPPTFRQDLQIPADIVEEIARIYGYHNLPSTLMTGPIPIHKPTDADFTSEDEMKNFLANIGWQEIYTYSAVSQEVALQSVHDIEKHLKLLNPLTEDHVYLRRSLIPSLSQAIKANPQRKNLSVFELTSTYQPQAGKLPSQDLKLGLVSSNNYRDFRRDVEALLSQFYIEEVIVGEEQKPESDFYQQQAPLLVKAEDEQMVELGAIYLLQNGLLGAQLDYQTLLKLARKYPHYQARTKTSTIIEDLTFTLKPNSKIGRVISSMAKAHELIKRVELKDSYQQNYTFTLCYQHPQKNLSTEDVQPVRKKVVATVKNNHDGELVGELK